MSDQEQEPKKRMHWFFQVVIALVIGGFVLALLVFGLCVLSFKR